jgi:protease-4
MSPEFRREMDAILDDYHRQVVDAIAEGRKLDREKVMAAIDSGPHTAKAAKELGLIDRVAYEDEAANILKGDGGREVKVTRRYGKKQRDTDFSGFAGMMKMMNMMMGLEEPKRRTSTPKIAVIHATGAIMEGKSATDFLSGQTLGSETFIKAVRTAGEDASVKAVVLRVDSPGGSALASDLMWRALEKLDKPVIVSMGDVAASGGYYISMGADRIFAEPGTLTGSIGVVGGKIALNGLFNKVGITTTVLSRGKNSGVMSIMEGFTDSEREAMTKMLHDIYDQFTRKAAQGRKMEHEKLEKLARGRVYTGAMALKIGLVDQLGTLDDAVAYARNAAGLKPEDKVERMILPKPVSPLEQLFGPLDPDAEVQSHQTSSLVEAARSTAPELVEQLQGALMVQLLAREGRLLLMPFRLSVK